MALHDYLDVLVCTTQTEIEIVVIVFESILQLVAKLLDQTFLMQKMSSNGIQIIATLVTITKMQKTFSLHK